MAGGPKGEVKYALKKWWKSYVYTTGMRVQSQSPFRADHITPFFKHMPISMWKKITENAFDVVPSFALLVAVVWWSDSTFMSEQKKHRS